MLSLHNISKRFALESNSVQAVHDLSLEVAEGEFFTLLGPSGCGKSTTLRCIAGLEMPEQGEIILDDQVVYSRSKGQVVPVFQRDIGMVFQSYAIWPHMTVFDNVAYPLRVAHKRPKKEEVRERVLAALALVRLEGLADRPAPQLSGGQQQRVALARALVRNPKLLLLDEPLSNLDAKLREQMRSEMRDLVRKLGITTIYVTHDQLEALVMSDRVAVMQDGRLVQLGSSRDIYRRPESSFVAGFVGAANLLQGKFERSAVSEDAGTVQTAIGPISCKADTGISDGQTAVLAIRPESLAIAKAVPHETTNVFQGQVQSLDFQGDSVLLRVQSGPEVLQVKTLFSEEIDVGEHVYLVVRPENCRAMSL